MDKLTPDALVTFLWVTAALVAFVLAILGLIEKIKAVRKPVESMKQWQIETELKLKRVGERLDALESGQKVMLRGLNALIRHEINGNSVDKLNSSEQEIMDYLIEK